jgi:hypothetical protein
MTNSELTSEKTTVCTESGAVSGPGGKLSSRLRRFTGLGLTDQVLLLRALLTVSGIRVGLSLLPFRFVQRFAERNPKKSNPMDLPDRYVWAIRAVCRYVPGATCLTQALAAQVLLAQSGHKSHIEIGVRKDEQQRLLAHAWVVYGDQIVIGGAEANDYLPFEALKTRTEGIYKS